MRKTFHRLIAVSLLLLAGLPAGAQTIELTPGGSFADDDGSVHEGAIEAIAAEGITTGCHDEDQLFCPDESVTRGQLAAFLVRAFDLAGSDADRFLDDEVSIFEVEINALAASEITLGCDPPANTMFCPEAAVTRAQMATFLVRAMGLDVEFPEPEPQFVDTDTSEHRVDIDRLALAGVTVGCNPPDNDRFCPHDRVTRAEMASFLARALDLDPIIPPPRPPVELVSQITTYHACCESRVTNIHLMAEAIDGAVVYPGESFSINGHVGQRTEAKGYLPAPILIGGEPYCCDSPLNIGGGTSQLATTFYNAVFWGGYEILEHKPHSRYFDRYPLGIEATLGYPDPDVVFVNDTWTPVTIDTSYGDTSITVRFYGNNLGRDVDGEVTGTATYQDGGSVVVARTITGSDGTAATEFWYWTYIGG